MSSTFFCLGEPKKGLRKLADPDVPIGLFFTNKPMPRMCACVCNCHVMQSYLRLMLFICGMQGTWAEWNWSMCLSLLIISFRRFLGRWLLNTWGKEAFTDVFSKALRSVKTLMECNTGVAFLSWKINTSLHTRQTPMWLFQKASQPFPGKNFCEFHWKSREEFWVNWFGWLALSDFSFSFHLNLNVRAFSQASIQSTPQ